MVMPIQQIATKSKHAKDLEEVHQWLADFAQAVRARDIEKGRSLFAPDVVGFGTRTAFMAGLDALVEQQWRPIWNSTHGFCFQLDDVQAAIEGNLAWAAAPWTSWGIANDGKNFQRRGRATYVLQRRGSKWLAVHSHHSLNPI
jgi:ketosteroid isomerase-like protein